MITTTLNTERDQRNTSKKRWLKQFAVAGGCGNVAVRARWPESIATKSTAGEVSFEIARKRVDAPHLAVALP
jgi:hypothetical protein